MWIIDYVKQLLGVSSYSAAPEPVQPVQLPDPSLLQKNMLFTPNQDKTGEEKSIIAVYSGNPFRRITNSQMVPMINPSSVENTK